MMILPFNYQAYEEGGTLEWMFEGVVFTEDFGPFKEGDEFAQLDFDLELGTITAYVENGEDIIANFDLRSKNVDGDDEDSNR